VREEARDSAIIFFDPVNSINSINSSDHSGLEWKPLRASRRLFLSVSLCIQCYP